MAGFTVTQLEAIEKAIASGTLKVRTRDTAERPRNARDWTTHWSAASMDAPWQVTLLTLQDGTHAATIGETYRRAMLWLFREDIPMP